MKNLPWTKLLAGALVGVAIFSWFQFREVNQLQHRVGNTVAEQYRQLGNQVGEMRRAVGRVLVATTDSRDSLQNHYGGRWRMSASSLIIDLRGAPNGPDELYTLYHFFQTTEAALQSIARGEGPLDDEERAYLENLHTWLVDLEEIYRREQEFMWGDSRKVARTFYRGQVWPKILGEMATSIGDDVGRIYQKYGFTPARERDYEPPRNPEIPGETITQAQGLAAAQEFMGFDPGEYRWELSSEGYNSYYGDSWTFWAVPQDGDVREDAWEIEVLTTGGHVIRAYRTPAVRLAREQDRGELLEPQITPEQALAAAKELAEQCGLTDYGAPYVPWYDNFPGKAIYHVALNHRVGGVYNYNLRLEIQVDGEIGDIIGWERLNLVTHEESVPPQPLYSRDEARKKVAEGRYSVQDGPTIYFPSGERIFYFFRVDVAGRQYDVHFNGLTGEEDYVGDAGSQFWDSY